MEGFNIEYKGKELVMAVKNNNEEEIVIERDHEADSEKEKEEDFMVYASLPPAFKFNPNTTKL